MSLLTSPTRTSRFKRAALVLSAGLFATTLAIGGGFAANAAPGATVTANATTATVNGHVTLNAVGFDAAEFVTISFDSTFVTSGNAEADGTYENMLFVPEDATIGNHSATVVGDTSGTFTLPVEVVAPPTVSPATATVTASVFGTTGVKVDFSGFTVGDSVQFSAGGGGMGGPVGTPVTVGANGIVSYTLRASDVGTGAVVPGVYGVGATTVAGNIWSQPSSITVVADPAAPATPVKARASFTG
jgi:hypothetical protein